MNNAEVKIWNKTVGYLSFIPSDKTTYFEYDDEFTKGNLDISPIEMSIKNTEKKIYNFPRLNQETYKTLPGTFAESLPDKFGNLVIRGWLIKQGRDPESLNPVEQLCYQGNRGMGALEYYPAIRKETNTVSTEINELINIVSDVISQKKEFSTTLNRGENAISEIIRMSTSAGGARAKAIIAFNEQTGEIRSGQLDAPDGFDQYIIKFDGFSKGTLSDSQGYGRIEHAYYEMAKDCGINMMNCRLHVENNRTHFMTQRFDRAKNEKIHMQSLCGIAHFDYNDPASNSYEQGFSLMHKLRLPYNEIEEFFKRMVFNILACNYDDHTKNISFLMDKTGKWKLSPAYDITYAYDPKSYWLSKHQMSVNSKRENISKDDLLQVAQNFNIARPKDIINKTVEIVNKWDNYSKRNMVYSDHSATISNKLSETLKGL